MNFVGKFERLAPLTNLTDSEWEEMMEVNINSYWRILKELEPLLKKAKNPEFYSLLMIIHHMGNHIKIFLVFHKL